VVESAAQRTAEDLLRLVDVDPSAAWHGALDVIDAAERVGEHAAVSVASRAAGLAALHLAHLDTAVDRLQKAVVSARRMGSPQLEGEAMMSLAFAFTRRGEPAKAVRTIQQAIDALDGAARARARCQRGAILQQLGRLDEAWLTTTPRCPR
jgi:tetratricopeptide (TPR) repeat protein